MKSLFVIRDKKTGSFCSSSKFRHFDTEVNSASLFDSQKNAEKAIRSMMSFLTKAVNPYGGNVWSLVNGDVAERFCHGFKEEYIEMLRSKDHLKDLAEGWVSVKEAQLDLEVVEVKLTLVG
jgi:hypothetical protein